MLQCRHHKHIGVINMYTKFESGHAYARRNGYKGTYEEYIKLHIEAYRTICKRCSIKPLMKDQWFILQ